MQQMNSATVTIPGKLLFEISHLDQLYYSYFLIALMVRFVMGSPSTQSTGTSGCTTPVDKRETTDGSATDAAASKSSSQQYWAKGTIFGTGSTARTWDVDGFMHRQRAKEEQATCLMFHNLTAYMHTGWQPNSFTNLILLPAELLEIVQSFYLISAICNLLKNDSG